LLLCFAALGQVLYDLDGVIQHEGKSITSGHFSTFVRMDTTKWRHFNDAKVSEVDGAKAVNEDAVLLMYTRRPPR
ncbi:unnamed protein product, partial [Hapterophycus canaliculatus]